ncbi:hypothetical protein GWI33_001091 [Rhynchophorus ferrugineus]|uniref:Uncharacterized protein n=1 Tax=Rhynchophorus ferrugineus TaxID=354439 RepID=A0A834IQS3_RHYFE|nr:hypothetical protein GWI33_001091 [Rhynchophorus ferrugineus]
MEAAERFVLRHLDIKMRQTIFSLISILNNIQTVGKIITLDIYKEQCSFDIVLMAENDKKHVFGIYLEGPHKIDQEKVVVRPFLDKYFQRLKNMKPFPYKFQVYLVSQFLNPVHCMCMGVLTDFSNFIATENTIFWEFMDSIKTNISYDNIPEAEVADFDLFQSLVKFINYDTINSLQFPDPKIDSDLVNPIRMNLVLLNASMQHFNTCSSSEILNMGKNLKYRKTCEDLSELNIEFINQLHVNFIAIKKKLNILYDKSIYNICIDTNSTLLTVMKIVKYLSNKKFILLSDRQLRFEKVSTEAFGLLFNDKIDVLIIEYDGETETDNHPLYLDRVPSMKTGKIVQIFNRHKNKTRKKYQKLLKIYFRQYIISGIG